MSAMKLVYVAGPYTAATAWLVEQNIRRAEETAVRVWAAGMAALCPHANARHMLEGLVSPEIAYEGTLEMMRRSDAVLLVGGWERSAGTRAEVHEAINLGIPVLYSWGDEDYCHRILCDLRDKPPGFRVRQGEDTLTCPFKGAYWGAPLL